VIITLYRLSFSTVVTIYLHPIVILVVVTMVLVVVATSRRRISSFDLSNLFDRCVSMKQDRSLIDVPVTVAAAGGSTLLATIIVIAHHHHHCRDVSIGHARTVILRGMEMILSQDLTKRKQFFVMGNVR
jgi:hypothetical protein